MNNVTLAKKLGLKIKLYKHDVTWGIYDGKMVHISTASPPHDIDHEIGHFLAATLRERTKPEWNLGRGADYPPDEILAEVGIPNLVDSDAWAKTSSRTEDLREAREGAASLFGIAVTYTFGPKDAWRKHADLHSWERSGTACDPFCLIADTNKFHLKNRLAKVLAQIRSFK